MFKWPGSEEPNKAGFALAHATELPIMFLKTLTGAAEGVLVDVDGGTGTSTAEIARCFPKLKCVVQDLPAVITAATVPEDLKENERLTFVAHDFFKEQHIKDADVYYMRWILHDILQALLPALKPGARILG
ncbi:hypothetical protein ACMFMF_000869 [Clarireedia jacksonii]